jgi:hypothetical protein
VGREGAPGGDLSEGLQAPGTAVLGHGEAEPDDAAEEGRGIAAERGEEGGDRSGVGGDFRAGLAIQCRRLGGDGEQGAVGGGDGAGAVGGERNQEGAAGSGCEGLGPACGAGGVEESEARILDGVELEDERVGGLGELGEGGGLQPGWQGGDGEGRAGREAVAEVGQECGVGGEAGGGGVVIELERWVWAGEVGEDLGDGGVERGVGAGDGGVNADDGDDAAIGGRKDWPVGIGEGDGAGAGDFGGQDVEGGEERGGVADGLGGERCPGALPDEGFGANGVTRGGGRGQGEEGGEAGGAGGENGGWPQRVMSKSVPTLVPPPRAVTP